MMNEVMVAFLARNAAKAEDVPSLMKSVHATLVELARPEPFASPPLKPAFPAFESVTPDCLVCLDCGRRFRSLRYHLAKHGLSPAGYRVKWDLPSDYPMVAPTLAAKRSTLAFKGRFGHYRKRKERKPAKQPSRALDL